MSQFTQLAHQGFSPNDVGHGGRFGQLEGNQRRHRVIGAQLVLEETQEFIIAQRLAGQIHCKAGARLAQLRRNG